MEWWSDGVVEWWSDGVMEWWSGGVMGREDLTFKGHSARIVFYCVIA
jgi:hypothetical protein